MLTLYLFSNIKNFPKPVREQKNCLQMDSEEFHLGKKSIQRTLQHIICSTGIFWVCPGKCSGRWGKTASSRMYVGIGCAQRKF